MSKVLSVVALAVAIAACLLTRWVYLNQQQSLERALKQREAQLSQRYAGLINRMIDRVADSCSQSNAQTIEEALERLEDAIEASRKMGDEESHAYVENIGNLEVVERATPFARVGESSRGTAPKTFAIESRHKTSEFGTQSGMVELIGAEMTNAQVDQVGFVPVEGRIVFVSDDGDGEIYTINADGTNKMRLTRNDVHDLYPTWSPDGKQIAFVSDSSGERELYIMNENGKELLQITDNDLAEGAPSWSADGHRIAMSVVRDGNAKDIHIISVDGSAEPIVIQNASLPNWSPDGKQIAFNRDLKIYLANSDGTSETPLIDEDMGASNGENRGARNFMLMPRWSPDGSQIMYTGIHFEPGVRDPDDVRFGVHIFDVKSDRSRRVSADQSSQLGLDWSADGKHIVYFNWERQGRGELFVMNATGDSQFRLTRAADFDAWASWRHPN
jgi:Tol biopolymer transport system component